MVKAHLVIGRLYLGFRLDGGGLRVYYGINQKENAKTGSRDSWRARKLLRIGWTVGIMLLLDALLHV